MSDAWISGAGADGIRINRAMREVKKRKALNASLGVTVVENMPKKKRTKRSIVAQVDDVSHVADDPFKITRETEEEKVEEFHEQEASDQDGKLVEQSIVLVQPAGKSYDKKEQPAALKAIPAIPATRKNKGKYVFDPSKSMNTTCSPAKVCKLLPFLNDDQVKAVDDMGFGGLLKMKLDQLPNDLIRDLVVRFCWAVDTQTVGKNVYLITSDDVHDIFGLPIGGTEIKEVNNAGKQEKEDLDLREKWMINFGVDKYDRVPCDRLESYLEETNKADEKFMRVFAMYVICSFLCPTARSCIDMKLVRTLSDSSSIKTFDWCEYVLRKLRMAVNSFHTKPFKAVNGCLPVLLFCFLYRFPLRGQNLRCDLPLVGNYDTKEVLEKCRLVQCAGFESLIKSTQVFPLTSKGKLKSCSLMPSSTGASSSSDKSNLRQLVFDIPMDLPTDEQIRGIAPDVLAELSAQFRRNVDVVVRAHMGALQQHFLEEQQGADDESSSLSREVLSAAVTASQEYFKDPKIVKGYEDAFKNVMKKYAAAPLLLPQGPRNRPSPKFDLGIDQLQEDLETVFVNKVVDDVNGAKAAAMTTKAKGKGKGKGKK